MAEHSIHTLRQISQIDTDFEEMMETVLGGGHLSDPSDPSDLSEPPEIYDRALGHFPVHPLALAG